MGEDEGRDPRGLLEDEIARTRTWTARFWGKAPTPVMLAAYYASQPVMHPWRGKGRCTMPNLCDAHSYWLTRDLRAAINQLPAGPQPLVRRRWDRDKERWVIDTRDRG